MKSMLSVSPFLFVLVALPCYRLAADPFPKVDKKLVANKEVTLRGVINLVTVPVPDAVEAKPTQSGYFIITPYPLDAEGEDEFREEKMNYSKEQIMLHLVIPNDLQKTIEKLMGKPVKIDAAPFPAHTSHHKTPFLLHVKSLKALAK
jgi:hypothetical protein